MSGVYGIPDSPEQKMRKQPKGHWEGRGKQLRKEAGSKGDSCTLGRKGCSSYTGIRERDKPYRAGREKTSGT
jgi:hypothetical protein